ncbi:hypothetical protein GF362_01035 [Candidatus Dojkabacteria bacterium]|nr:hypothetical protein [Candidatus Dojkabacteria bacterium]
MAEEKKNSKDAPKKVGFFQKVKQWLGIGGVKVKLDVPPEVNSDDNEIKGKLLLTAKSEQHVKSYEIVFEEKWQYKKNGETKYKTIQLGKRVVEEPFDIKEGEEKEIEFSCPFQFAKTMEDELKDKGGVLGAIGSASAFVKGHKSTYWLKATVDVDKTAIDPSANKIINVVRKKK